MDLPPSVCFVGIYLTFLGTPYSFVQPPDITVNVGFILDSRVPMDIDSGIKAALQISNISHSKYDNSSQKQKIFLFDTIVRTNISDNYHVSQVVCKQLKETIAIVTMATKQTMEVIDSFGPTLDLPFIVSTGPRVHRHDNGSTIFMTPSYIPAIVDYIIFNEWNRVYYMYDSNEGLLRMEELAMLYWKHSGSFRLTYHRMSDDDHHVYSDLYHMDRRDPAVRQKVFILDFGTKSATTRVMKMMIDSGMNRNGYHIIIGGFNIGEYEEFLNENFLHGGVNITGFKFLTKEDKDAIYVVNKLKTNDIVARNYTMSIEAALFMDGVAHLSYALHTIGKSLKPRQGIIRRCRHCHGNLCTDAAERLLLKTLKQIRSEGLSGHIAFDDKGYRKDYGLRLFKFGFRSPLKEIGNWSSTTGIQLQRKNKTNH